MTDFMVTPSGQLIHHVHDPSRCAGEFCCVHNPSNHHMRAWQLYWRDDRRIFERICPHGIGHPDPDGLAFRKRIGHPDADGLHGCDGCCSPADASYDASCLGPFWPAQRAHKASKRGAGRLCHLSESDTSEEATLMDEQLALLLSLLERAVRGSVYDGSYCAGCGMGYSERTAYNTSDHWSGCWVREAADLLGLRDGPYEASTTGES